MKRISYLNIVCKCTTRVHSMKNKCLDILEGPLSSHLLNYQEKNHN